MFNIPLIFMASFILSYLFTIPTIYFAKKIGFITDKSKRKHPAHVHVGVVPRAGGLPIFLSLLITTLIFIPLNKIIVGILLAASLLTLVGLLDDYFDISPYYRFVMNLFISAIVIGFGLGIPYISNPFGGVIRLDTWVFHFNLFGPHTVLVIADILAIIWLSWTTNMVNWSKGVDGQLPGFVAITAFFLAVLSQRFTAYDISAQAVMLLSFIVSASFLGFLPFNFFPQKIMPGYGGGALAGFLLGILSILSFGKLGTAVLILSVPMIDAFYVIFRRLRKFRSPFKADWGHFHHKLLEIGWGKRRIAVFYWSISLILGISSMFLKGVEKVIAFVMTGILLLTFILVIEKVKSVRNHTK